MRILLDWCPFPKNRSLWEIFAVCGYSMQQEKIRKKPISHPRNDIPRQQLLVIRFVILVLQKLEHQRVASEQYLAQYTCLLLSLHLA